MKNEIEHVRSRWGKRFSLSAAVFGVMAAWFFWPHIAFLWRGLEAPTEAAQFGDFYGPLNTLFSGLAMLGVIVAIVLQKRELVIQQDMLRQQIAESQQQTAQLGEQAAQFKAQNQLIQKEQARVLEEYERAKRISEIEALPSFVIQISGSDIVVTNYGSTVRSVSFQEDQSAAAVPDTFIANQVGEMIGIFAKGQEMRFRNRAKGNSFHQMSITGRTLSNREFIANFIPANVRTHCYAANSIEYID